MKSSQTPFISIAALVLFVGTSLNVYAESNSCAGSSTMTVEQQNAMLIAAADGHMVLLTQDAGPVESTGIFESGTAIDQNVHQLYQGNGNGYGYYTVTTDQGTAVAKWSGTVNTIIKDGNPFTSFKGKWEFANGSGKFQDITGGGVYDGYFTSASTRVVNWKGQCILAHK